MNSQSTIPSPTLSALSGAMRGLDLGLDLPTAASGSKAVPFDLLEPLLSAAMRHAASIHAAPDKSSLIEAIHACLTAAFPSTHLIRVALATRGCPPKFTSFAERGDLHTLDLFARFKVLDPESPDGKRVFWAAVAANQVKVLDWWAKVRGWRVASESLLVSATAAAEDGKRSVEPTDPLSRAVRKASVDAIAWLVDHPDVVGNACKSEMLSPGRPATGAMTDVGVAELVCTGHKALALRWIRSRYHVGMLERSATRNLPKWDKYIPDPLARRGWSSRLMQVVGTRGLLDMLKALVDGGDMYKDMVEDNGSFIVREAIRKSHLHVLEWWFDHGQPWDLEITDLVAWASECNDPVAVLDLWKRRAVGSVQASLNYAGAHGPHTIRILDWLCASGLDVKYSQDAMDFASQHGNLEVLNWWRTSGLELKYTEAAMDLAPDHKVLDWWLNSGLELKYSTKAMDFQQDRKMMDWWRNQHFERGLQLKYTAVPLDRASSAEDIQVLIWWTDSGLPMRAERALLCALLDDKHGMVDWWMTNAGPDLLEVMAAKAWAHAFSNGLISLLDKCERLGLPATKDTKIIDECVHVGALQWWAERFDSLPFAYTERALAKASESGRVDLLEWWDESGLELLYDETAMDLASASGHTDVLEWWFLSGLELEYTEATMDQASIKGRTDILTWWFQSGLELKYTGAAMETSKVSHYAKVNKWWKRSGLALPAVKSSVDLLSSSS
ncbi:hypothetical protein BCR44DRAFT_73414 [Catenaria anguillulae PL171]|uniref:Ankyrin repeat-containing domain protein n=1 Tax=Catenaria anguillulae PL171 TaxID=765915 RepID=A0A1Y2HP39_9FUNG|nr:hypothetical protein BCR44DRAFT_73414 [Catenaria anguillulae PL171]